MRTAQISVLTNKTASQAELALAVERSMRNFLSLATSNEHSRKINAMDAIGLVKLCRKSGQPVRVAEIWPHVQRLSLLPAKDERTSRVLIGSFVTASLEAKNSATAASLWEYLRTFPHHLPLSASTATQLLSALRGCPALIVDVITALEKEAHGVRADAQHYAVAMQALCGAFEEANKVFELALKSHKVDGVTLAVWCQVLQEHKDPHGALTTLSLADSLFITPIPAHYTVLLSCAAETKSLSATKQIHEHLSKHSTAAKTNTGTVGALVQSYAQCGDLESAKSVFQQAIKNANINAVTLVVWCQALQQHNDLDGALSTLALANSLSIVPTPAHYTVLLSCAAELKSLAATRCIHNHLRNHPTAASNIITLGALLHTYAQCGELEAAVGVFEDGLQRGLVFNVKGWNCLASAYLGYGMVDQAEATLERMIAAGVNADEVTLVVWCQVFERRKDLVGALRTLALADSLSIVPTPAHYTVLLSCAAELKSLAATRRIHQHISEHPAAQMNNGTVGALVHGYAQCGERETAIALFEDGLRHGLVFDIQGWNTLLGVFTEHGMLQEALDTLERIVAAGVKPSEVTALCLLNAASHAGLGLGVKQLHKQLQTRFPDLALGATHQTCVIDGLARSGFLDEAVAEAHALKNHIAWTAVLGGARLHNRLDIGELALKEICKLTTENAALASAHVQMSHIYTANTQDDKAAEMRQFLKTEGFRKLPGESSIEVDGVMHTFRVNDTSHPEMKQIVELNDKLHEQLKAEGYVPDVVWASRGAEVSTKTKEQALCEHSERFALVYGLLHSEEGQPLTIFKNLRVCGDCHNATKHASKVLGRRLFVKDLNRWHVFENGKCSCGDFW